MLFSSFPQCVEHLHLSNVVHCNLSAMSFMRFYDGIYRIIDVQDSRLGSEFYGLLNVDVCPIFNAMTLNALLGAFALQNAEVTYHMLCNAGECSGLGAPRVGNLLPGERI